MTHDPLSRLSQSLGSLRQAFGAEAEKLVGRVVGESAGRADCPVDQVGARFKDNVRSDADWDDHGFVRPIYNRVGSSSWLSDQELVAIQNETNQFRQTKREPLHPLHPTAENF